MHKLDLEKAEEPEIKWPRSVGSQKKLENLRKTSTSASLTTLKPFDCVDHNKLWEIIKEIGIPDHLTCLPQKTCMQVRKQQLEPDIEQQTGIKLGKEYVKAVYCHTTYLTYIQNTSCDMPGWMKHKLKSRLQRKNRKSLQRETGISSDIQITPPLWWKVKRNYILLMKVKEESEKSWLKTQHSKN